jgi:ketosteroid isomerase-like protein
MDRRTELLSVSTSKEFEELYGSLRRQLCPKPESIEVFGDVAVTYYFWPQADETSPVKTRITHTWRKEPKGWRIISGTDCAVSSSSSGSAEGERRRAL